MREATNNKKATLGELIKKHPDVLPKPLDVAVDRIWGFSSEQGRHLREGRIPEYLEAELLVGISSSISTYLAAKFAKITKIEDDDLPF